MVRNEEAKKTLWQIAKFAIVGVLNPVVDFAVFQTLNLTLGWVYAAQVLGYTAGVINSYLWNSNWTFREQRTRSFREIALFLLVNLASLGVSLGMIWLLREKAGITNEWVAGWMPKALAGFIKGDTVCIGCQQPVQKVARLVVLPTLQKGLCSCQERGHLIIRQKDLLRL